VLTRRWASIAGTARPDAALAAALSPGGGASTVIFGQLSIVASAGSLDGPEGGDWGQHHPPEPGMCRPTLLQGTLGSTVTTEKSPSSLTTTCFPPK
jgi:hypothetical protein